MKLRKTMIFYSLKTQYTRLFFLAFSIFFSFSLYAQEIAVKIKITSTNQINVEGNFKDKKTSTQNLTFLQNYADVSNLDARIENLQTSDNKGSWKYYVNLAPSNKLTDSAHVSWLTENGGLLMLNDLLPKFEKSVIAQINFELPSGWKIATSEDSNSNQTFQVKNIENAVFAVGNNFRERTVQNRKTVVSVLFAGGWQFSEDEALEMIGSVLTEHQTIFKEIPTSKIQIILSPFPQENSNPERWRAETRGSTVTIISGSLPFKSQALQRLHEQLRHELFHLWLPNAVNLSGNYDWFYEGFTVYQALRTGVELNQIRFEDFLNTLSRAFQIEQTVSVGGQNLSLLELSDKRWAGASNSIYAKGLVVAFLSEVVLLRENRGKRNLKDVFRQIWNKHRFPNQVQDGTTAILSILNSFSELRPIVQSYIFGKARIDWENELKAIGIAQEKTDLGIQLKVIANANGRQKDLLDKLGYNQWRKFGQKKR